MVFRCEIAKLAARLSSIDIEDVRIPDDNAVYWMKRAYGDLDDLEYWFERTRASLRSRLGEAHDRELVRHLREDHNGMPQPEVEACIAMADKIERNLSLRPLSRLHPEPE
jgi:hypothetical protein